VWQCDVRNVNDVSLWDEQQNFVENVREFACQSVRLICLPASNRLWTCFTSACLIESGMQTAEVKRSRMETA